MTFSERLKEIREENGYTQQELAETLHLTPSSVSHYENGTRQPNVEILIEMANYLDISIDYLLGFSIANIPPSQMKKSYYKSLENGKLIERLLRLDTNHRQILISVLKCIETDQFVSEKGKQK